MKRLVLVALLLLGGVLNARADSDVYDNITKHPRNDEVLQADAKHCRQSLRAPRNGTPTSKAYKRCMLAAAGATGVLSAITRVTACTPIPTTRPDVQGFHDRRHHRIKLFEFLKARSARSLAGRR